MTWLEWLAVGVVAIPLSWGLWPAILYPPSKLPAILRGTHTDWWWFLHWVPRRLTAFIGGWRPPIQLFGTNPWAHQDVPAPGTWCVSWPPHVAVHTIRGTLFGCGIRFDYVDGYWTIRLVWRHV